MLFRSKSQYYYLHHWLSSPVSALAFPVTLPWCPVSYNSLGSHNMGLYFYEVGESTPRLTPFSRLKGILCTNSNLGPQRGGNLNLQVVINYFKFLSHCTNNVIPCRYRWHRSAKMFSARLHNWLFFILCMIPIFQ